MITYGSVCSGIEAASVALKRYKFSPLWFSEIAEFPNKLLSYHYPNTPNIGDMVMIPNLLRAGRLPAPELLCGGTPCQAFSLAGWKQGLLDSRGILTLSFIDIADAIDEQRLRGNKERAVILWENVEGVLRDKTNAFGIFLSGLAGLDVEVKVNRWTTSGVLRGKTRNIAWRVLDAKYFGLPQQRRRLFVVACGTDKSPENIIFEILKNPYEQLGNYKNLYSQDLESDFNLFDHKDKISGELKKNINDVHIEVFREYTDCLYSAYGTKWNGNAAAYNGSLYVSQNNRVRRFTPLECERLMGFPDDYTNIPGNSDTNRYQAIGNSWAIPVIQWIGGRIYELIIGKMEFKKSIINGSIKFNNQNILLISLDFSRNNTNNFLNASPCPNNFRKGNIFEIIDINAKEKFYLSSQGLAGILRRKREKVINMNTRLEGLFIINSENS